jgi:hypothetical protein
MGAAPPLLAHTTTTTTITFMLLLNDAHDAPHRTISVAVTDTGRDVTPSWMTSGVSVTGSGRVLTDATNSMTIPACVALINESSVDKVLNCIL